MEITSKSYANSDAGNPVSTQHRWTLDGFSHGMQSRSHPWRGFSFLPYGGVCVTNKPIKLLRRGRNVILVITPTSVQHRPARGTAADSCTAATYMGSSSPRYEAQQSRRGLPEINSSLNKMSSARLRIQY